MPGGRVISLLLAGASVCIVSLEPHSQLTSRQAIDTSRDKIAIGAVLHTGSSAVAAVAQLVLCSQASHSARPPLHLRGVEEVVGDSIRRSHLWTHHLEAVELGRGLENGSRVGRVPDQRLHPHRGSHMLEAKPFAGGGGTGCGIEPTLWHGMLLLLRSLSLLVSLGLQQLLLERSHARPELAQRRRGEGPNEHAGPVGLRYASAAQKQVVRQGEARLVLPVAPGLSEPKDVVEPRRRGHSPPRSNHWFFSKRQFSPAEAANQDIA